MADMTRVNVATALKKHLAVNSTSWSSC